MEGGDDDWILIFGCTVPLTGSYLVRVDVESSHRPRVLLALSNDHIALSGHDLCGVVQDDVAVLASCDENAGRVSSAVHSIRTPDQFVVSVEGERRSLCGEQLHSKETQSTTT